eukprot:scaffold67394_cov19-Tisochrysis_lutea.AAC.2
MASSTNCHGCGNDASVAKFGESVGLAVQHFCRHAPDFSVLPEFFEMEELKPHQLVHDSHCPCSTLLSNLAAQLTSRIKYVSDIEQRMVRLSFSLYHLNDPGIETVQRSGCWFVGSPVPDFT